MSNRRRPAAVVCAEFMQGLRGYVPRLKEIHEYCSVGWIASAILTIFYEQPQPSSQFLWFDYGCFSGVWAPNILLTDALQRCPLNLEWHILAPCNAGRGGCSTLDLSGNILAGIFLRRLCSGVA